MKILCVIDSLGSGGAQRQMVNLVCGLKSKGHAVELLVYFPDARFFRAEIDAAGILVHEIRKGGGFSLKVLWSLIRLYRSGQFDVVISFLDTPNIYAELAKLFALSSIKLIVSERSSSLNERKTIFNKLKRLSHLLADFVVANSHSHANWLCDYYWLRNKTKTIYNGYFVGDAANVSAFKEKLGNLSLLAIGRIDTGKNGLRLMQGVEHFYQKHGDCPTVFWAGRQAQDADSLRERQEMEEFLSQHPVIARHWHFMGERRDVPGLLQQADALIHVSMYEGLPNVVCEAFVAARPVIASNVCDHPVLIEDGVRGFLCDPLSPESICESIERFFMLTIEERQQMGRSAWAYAKQYLTNDRMVSDYEALFLFAK